MTPAQLYRRACEQARTAKETTPTHPVAVGITVWRDEQEIAAVVLDQGTSEQMRCVAHMATVGMGAHCVCVVFEGWAASTAVNPATGNAWQAGQIGAYAGAHGVGGVVGEAVVVHVATAHGQVHAGALPFTAQGRQVTWGAPVEMRAADGAVPQTIAAALAQAARAPAAVEAMGRHPTAAGFRASGPTSTAPHRRLVSPVWGYGSGGSDGLPVGLGVQAAVVQERVACDVVVEGGHLADHDGVVTTVVLVPQPALDPRRDAVQHR